MGFLINVLLFVDYFLIVALIVALWERHDNRRFPTDADRRAKRERARRVLNAWRR